MRLERAKRASEAAELGKGADRASYMRLNREAAWEEYRPVRDPGSRSAHHRPRERRHKHAEEQELEEQEAHVPGG